MTLSDFKKFNINILNDTEQLSLHFGFQFFKFLHENYKYRLDIITG